MRRGFGAGTRCARAVCAFNGLIAGYMRFPSGCHAMGHNVVVIVEKHQNESLS